ncbi:MAG TPA: GNAT family N-acetyltransferase [Armatimonadota bacterium]|nr:GNAT family N-acetyltransferase [Armatimonadota bacterium]
MPDMLVKLYELPDFAGLLDELRGAGVEIRPAFSFEKRIVGDWITAHFSASWAAEAERGFAATPVSTLVAVEDGILLGFGSYDCTALGFFGPTGVREDQRGRGLGTALLGACLKAMWDKGYGYAVIGGAGPVEFYRKAVGATVIEGSVPGIYRNLLKAQPLEV